MRSAPKRVFRIERNNPLSIMPEVIPATDEEARHIEILAAIADLKKSGISISGSGDAAPAQTESQFLIDFKKELADARQLREELNEISQSISETKREIATLHHTNFGDNTDVQVADELDAVVMATEHATDAILTAAENVDANARDLAARLSGTEHEDMILDIQDQTIKIFEACNFQDLTGQRVQKVLETMKFIEGHIDKMITIWGGLDNFLDISPDSLNKKTGDDALLSGPGLDEDGAIRSSQDDIDSLFG
ncbi:MAG: protein phosphatase CheZ [Alphaproteobacteria bacterium]|nr:protein phosphatase CheZ [Alphaproteobacteria bacterium]